MTDCAEMGLLVQADLDGELSAAEAARVVAHLEGCAACAALQTELMGLSARLRQEVVPEVTPDTVRRAVSALSPRVPVRRWALPLGVGFGGGLALAASIALALMRPPEAGPVDAVVSGHVRALQPGHLLDVGSSDQHTVKPWFEGRLDYAPPVRDLVAAGFPLIGGRLDVLGGRPVAVLVYRHRQHPIDVFIVPGGSGDERGTVNGFNVVRWTEGGMTLWAVSDVAAVDLGKFVAAWRDGGAL